MRGLNNESRETYRRNVHSPTPNHNGVPNTNDLIESLPKSDTAMIVDRKTSSSVNGPYTSVLIVISVKAIELTIT